MSTEAKRGGRRRPASDASTTGAGMASTGLSEDQRQAGLLATSGLLHAAAVMESLQKNLMGEHATTDAILMGLEKKLDQVEAGDMLPVEAMLLSQAVSLQSIYASLVRRAVGQELLRNYQAFFTLALKAQAQSRATLEALVELKHPRHPTTFVKQANIANGPQQVNNGFPQSPAAPVRAHGQIGTEPNKLLEDTQSGGTYLDHGATQAAAGGHRALEAVGAVHRPQKPTGKETG